MSDSKFANEKGSVPMAAERHSDLAIGKFLHRLESGERRNSGEAVPDFDRAGSRPGADQLGRVPGKSRNIRRCESLRLALLPAKRRP